MNYQCNNRDTIHMQRCAQLMSMLVTYGPLPCFVLPPSTNLHRFGWLEIHKGTCETVELLVNSFLQEKKECLAKAAATCVACCNTSVRCDGDAALHKLSDNVDVMLEKTALLIMSGSCVTHDFVHAPFSCSGFLKSLEREQTENTNC